MKASPTTTARPLGQFSLQTLLTATVFAVLGLWAWRGLGLIGVVCFVAFVTIVVANLFIALFGARFGHPFLSGAMAGAILWSIAVASVTIPNEFVRFGNAWFKDPLVVTSLGLLAGLVCGGYAKLRIRRRQVRADLRIALVYRVPLVAFLRRLTFRFSIRTLLIVLTGVCIVLGWKVEHARKQRKVVTWVQEVGGSVAYDYEYSDGGTYLRNASPPGPKWLTERFGVDLFHEVVTVFLEGHASDVSPLAALKRLKRLSLRKTDVSDLTPLVGLARLEDLDLIDVPVNDVSPLASGCPEMAFFLF